MRATLLVLVVACGSDATPPTKPAPPLMPVKTDPWEAPPAAKPAPGTPAWTLTLQSDYGPCEPTDKRSCHKSWTATPDGSITYVEHPNDNGPATTTKSMMAVADRDHLNELVKTKDFTSGMAKGFPCEGPAPEYDASLRLIFDKDGASSRQYVLRCTRGDQNVAGELVELLRR